MGQHHPRFCWAAFKDGMRPLRFSMVAGLAFAVALVVGAAGCGGSSGGSGSKAKSTTTRVPTTEPALPPTTTRDQLKAQILEDYKKANDAYHDAINAGDPNLPALHLTHTGNNLQTVQRSTFELKSKGQLGRDGPHSRVTDRAVVEQVLETKAVVQDCEIDDGAIVEESTGVVVDSKTVTRLIRAELEKSGATWKVSSLRFLQEWDGVTGCAISHH